MSTATPTPLVGRLDRDDLPVFYGPPIAKVHSAIEWIHSRIKKTVWDVERLRKNYMRRTPAEILNDGDTLAIAPCPDRTVIAALLLRHNAVPFNLILHESESQETGLEPPTIHLAVEIENRAERYWFDFFALETRFVQGSYSFRGDRAVNTLQLTRLRGSDFDPFTLTRADIGQLISLEKTTFDSTLDWLCRAQSMTTSRMQLDFVAYDLSDSVYSTKQTRDSALNQ